MLKDLFASSRSFKLLLIGTIICTLYFQISEKWTQGNEKTIIYSDALGYYAYLPAVFIYHDLNFGFQEQYENKYYDAGKRANFCNIIDGKRTDKYFCGVSLMLIPFFLLACLFSKLFGYEIDGYSYFFQISVGVAALFYLIIGFIFLRKLLLYYCNEKFAVFIIFAFFFGSNLLYYTWTEPGMSHVYSFAVIAAFLYYSKKFFGVFTKRDVLMAAFFYGLLFLLRPSNAVIILALPFLAGSTDKLKQFFQFVFKDTKLLVSTALICFAVIFIQLFIFYLESGHWIVYSYTNEKFDFAHPEIMNVLFSYRKGLFIYTPLAFISLMGLIVLIRNNRYGYFTMLLVLAVAIWVISSWWSWWYGGSFGHRAFIEYFSLFAILLAILFNAIDTVFRKALLSVMVLLCVYLNLIQTLQFSKSILTPDGMTEEHYWNLFLKTGERYVGIYGTDLYIPKDMNTENAIVFKYDLESMEGISNTNTITDEQALSGKHSSKISGNVNYSVTIKKSVKDILKANDTIAFVQFKLSAWLESLDAQAKIVISFEHADGKVFDWHAYFVAHQVTEEKKWTGCAANVPFPKEAKPDDVIGFYIFQEDKATVYVDDLEVDLIKRK